MKIPLHLAIILDGNGRWAVSKGLSRNEGHVAGAKNVEEICRVCHEVGIKYLTVYAFSTENWSRPSDEVSALMALLRDYLKNCIETARENDMRVRVIGDRSALDEDIQIAIEELERATVGYGGLNFQIALNYGSRDEIIRAVNSIIKDIREGVVSSAVDENMLSSRLDTADIPDPDLLIRTSGEERLSNFLLWQCAYTEFYFTKVHWPDFTKDELLRALESYSSRERRYGGTSEA